MEDQSLKRFSRFVRNCLMSLRRDKSGRGDQARDRDRRSPPIKKYSRTDPDSNRRKPHRRAAVSSYDRGIEDSFSSALARYWEEFKLRSAQLSPAGGDSGCRMLSLTALSCFEVGRMAARRSRDTKEYTDPAELRSYPMHLRPLIAWEYIAALFEQNISDVSVFLHLAKACQTAEAHYQAFNFLRAAWRLLPAPSTSDFQRFLAIVDKPKDVRRWIDFFGETAGEKQTLNIDISGLASVLDRGDAVQLMCYFLSWAIEFDREEFVNHQVHMVLRKLLVHVYSTARSTCDACPCKKTIVRCGENIKRLRRTIPSYLCVAVLISCIQIGEHAHGSSSSHFVDYLCSTKFVISTEIDPIVDLFASLDCTEEMRQCLLRNQVNSLALAVTLVVIERYDYLHLQLSKRNIDIPVSLETLQSDRSTLEKNQTCVLWKYEPLIDSWVRKSPTLPQYRRSSISTADSFIIDSSRISLSSPRPNHLCSSPCPLTSTSP